jgi:hypothetical protein
MTGEKRAHVSIVSHAEDDQVEHRGRARSRQAGYFSREYGRRRLHGRLGPARRQCPMARVVAHRAVSRIQKSRSRQNQSDRLEEDDQRRQQAQQLRGYCGRRHVPITENNASDARSVTMRLIIRWSPPAWHFHFSPPAAWLDRLRCGLLGHDNEIVVGERIVALRCRRCSWRSSGWHLDRRVSKPVRPCGDADTAPLVPIALRPRTLP